MSTAAPGLGCITDACPYTLGYAGVLHGGRCAAGVSLGLVQHHFATKAGLIKAVDDYVLAVVITAITQPVPEQIGFGGRDR